MIFGYVQMKAGFFDRPKVKRSMDKATHRALSKFGAFVRTRARTSMRKNRGVSKPGQPPFTHTQMLRRGVLFAYEPTRENVVIGPVQLRQGLSQNAADPVSGTVPQVLEYGGQIRIRDRKRGSNLITERIANIEARPFMRPAFDLEIKKAPRLWQNAMRPA